MANLLIYGSLPTSASLESFRRSIARHSPVNDKILQVFRGFHTDAHPMAMISAVVTSMAAFYHNATDINDPSDRELFAHRIIAKLPSIAAAAHRCTISRNGPARFRTNGPTLHGLPAEPRFESSTRPFSLRQVFEL